MQSRTTNSIRNSLIAFLAQILSILFSFITRTVFIKTLGASYLGVNGLFSNILSMLSFAELGIGTAIIYAMYKPLADGDEKKISALMNLYAKAYKCIGISTAVIGVCLVPFLDILIKDKPDIPNLTLIYLLFLGNSSISYFFSYKRSIIIASQRGYLNTLNQITFSIIQNICQILILIYFKQYLLYLIVQIICTICSNISISLKVNKIFPYLRKYSGEKLDKVSQRKIGKNILAMMSSKIGSIVVSGTDNLLISAFVGLHWVGLFSNYVLIETTIKSIIMQVTNAITASIGNLTATESDEKSYDIFKNLFFINFVITTFCAIFLIVLFNPLISLWIGEKYLLNEGIISLIVLNFFIIQMRQPSLVFINTYGLFWEIKWKSLLEAGINLILSLVFLTVFDLGISGVLLGTISSNLLTNVWWEPYVIFKYGFKKKPKKYYSLYVKYVIIALFPMGSTLYLANTVVYSGLIGILVKSLICLIVPSVILFLVFYRSREFKYFMIILKKIIYSTKRIKR